MIYLIRKTGLIFHFLFLWSALVVSFTLMLPVIIIAVVLCLIAVFILEVLKIESFLDQIQFFLTKLSLLKSDAWNDIFKYG